MAKNKETGVQGEKPRKEEGGQDYLDK